MPLKIGDLITIMIFIEGWTGTTKAIVCSEQTNRKNSFGEWRLGYHVLREYDNREAWVWDWHIISYATENGVHYHNSKERG